MYICLVIHTFQIISHCDSFHLDSVKVSSGNIIFSFLYKKIKIYWLKNKVVEEPVFQPSLLTSKEWTFKPS